MVTASLQTGQGTGQAAPSEPQQGTGTVHANVQQLLGLTAWPTAMMGNWSLNIRH